MGEFVVLKYTTFEESNQRYFQIFLKVLLWSLKELKETTILFNWLFLQTLIFGYGDSYLLIL